MGQQQLLLLAIGLIVAAIAVLAGIEAVQQAIVQSAADRLVERNLTLAANAVAWKTQKDPFNGGNASYERLEEGGIGRLGLDEVTDAGDFKITAITASTLEITGVSTRYPQIGVRTYIENHTIVRTVVRHDGSITLDD